MIAGRFKAALLSAGVPVDDVIIGRVEDRSTWRVRFASGATAANRARAEAVLASFDASSAESKALEARAHAEADMSSSRLVMLMAALRLVLGRPPTEQERADAIDAYRAAYVDMAGK